MARIGPGGYQYAATTIEELAPETLLQIFSSFSAGSERTTLFRASLVCRRWRVAQSVLFETLELVESNTLRWLRTESRTRFTVRNLKLEATPDFLFCEVFKTADAVETLELKIIDANVPLPLLQAATLSRVKTLILHGLEGLTHDAAPFPFQLRHLTLHLSADPKSPDTAQLLIHATRATLLSLSLVDDSPYFFALWNLLSVLPASDISHLRDLSLHSLIPGIGSGGEVVGLLYCTRLLPAFTSLDTRYHSTLTCSIPQSWALRRFVARVPWAEYLLEVGLKGVYQGLLKDSVGIWKLVSRELGFGEVAPPAATKVELREDLERPEITIHFTRS